MRQALLKIFGGKFEMLNKTMWLKVDVQKPLTCTWTVATSRKVSG